MLRVISGVIIGYLVFALSALALFRVTHHDPHAPASVTLEVSTVIYGIVFALLAGYIARFIAGQQNALAVNLVALVMAVVAIVTLVMSGIQWTAVAALIFMVPAVLIGGRIRMRRDNN